MHVKDKLYSIILVMILAFLSVLSLNAQDEVVVRPRVNEKSKSLSTFKNSENKQPISAEQQYELAKARHLALQDEKTRMRILHDIKMTNAYYDKQKESKFVKWIKWQKFKLKRKGIL